MSRYQRHPAPQPGYHPGFWERLWGGAGIAVTGIAFLAFPYWVFHSWLADIIWWLVLLGIVLKIARRR